MNTPRVPIATTLQFFHRYFIWLVVFSYVIAAIMPAFGLWIRNIGFGRASLQQRCCLAADVDVSCSFVQCWTRGENGRTDSLVPKAVSIAYTKSH
jgi:hypothetical protein